MVRPSSLGIGLFLLLTLLLSGVFYALIIGTGHLGAGQGMYALYFWRRRGELPIRQRWPGSV